MAEKVSKDIPIAMRIINFGPENQISKEENKEFNKNYLVVIDGWSILQFVEKNPIVHYRCDEVKCYYLKGEPRLNSFIKSITATTVELCVKTCCDTGQLDFKITDEKKVVYYTDKVGINHAIIQKDIYDFLLKKPNLVVSPEGVLLFYTDKEIIATIDCNQYHWIDGRVSIPVGGKNKIIKDIEVCDDYCKVIILDDNKQEYCYSLKFEFDATEDQILIPKASNL